MHRELDVLGFLKHCHNIEVDVLANNCIINNWKTLHQKMNIAHLCCWWGQHPQEWKQGHLWRISLEQREHQTSQYWGAQEGIWNKSSRCGARNGDVQAASAGVSHLKYLRLAGSDVPQCHFKGLHNLLKRIHKQIVFQQKWKQLPKFNSLSVFPPHQLFVLDSDSDSDSFIQLQACASF